MRPSTLAESLNSYLYGGRLAAYTKATLTIPGGIILMFKVMNNILLQAINYFDALPAYNHNKDYGSLHENKDELTFNLYQHQMNGDPATIQQNVQRAMIYLALGVFAYNTLALLALQYGTNDVSRGPCNLNDSAEAAAQAAENPSEELESTEDSNPSIFLGEFRLTKTHYNEYSLLYKSLYGWAHRGFWESMFPIWLLPSNEAMSSTLSVTAAIVEFVAWEVIASMIYTNYLNVQNYSKDYNNEKDALEKSGNGTYCQDNPLFGLDYQSANCLLLSVQAGVYGTLRDFMKSLEGPVFQSMIWAVIASYPIFVALTPWMITILTGLKEINKTHFFSTVFGSSFFFMLAIYCAESYFLGHYNLLNEEDTFNHKAELYKNMSLANGKNETAAINDGNYAAYLFVMSDQLAKNGSVDAFTAVAIALACAAIVDSLYRYVALTSLYSGAVAAKVLSPLEFLVKEKNKCAHVYPFGIQFDNNNTNQANGAHGYINSMGYGMATFYHHFLNDKITLWGWRATAGILNWMRNCLSEGAKKYEFDSYGENCPSLRDLFPSVLIGLFFLAIVESGLDLEIAGYILNQFWNSYNSVYDAQNAGFGCDYDNQSQANCVDHATQVALGSQLRALYDKYDSPAAVTDVSTRAVALKVGALAFITIVGGSLAFGIVTGLLSALKDTAIVAKDTTVAGYQRFFTGYQPVGGDHGAENNASSDEEEGNNRRRLSAPLINAHG